MATRVRNPCEAAKAAQITTSTLTTWCFGEKKRSKEICLIPPERESLEEKVDAAEQEKSPRPTSPPPPPALLVIQQQHQQQPTEIQAAVIEQVVETEQKCTVVGMEKAMAFDEEKPRWLRWKKGWCLIGANEWRIL